MEDFMLFILGVVAMVLIFFGIYAYNEEQNYKSTYNTWVSTCRDKGGEVQKTAYQWSDCIINGELVVLPGYEKYQKDKPQ